MKTKRKREGEKESERERKRKKPVGKQPDKDVKFPTKKKKRTMGRKYGEDPWGSIHPHHSFSLSLSGLHRRCFFFLLCFHHHHHGPRQSFNQPAGQEKNKLNRFKKSCSFAHESHKSVASRYVIWFLIWKPVKRKKGLKIRPSVLMWNGKYCELETKEEEEEFQTSFYGGLPAILSDLWPLSSITLFL